MKYVHVPFQGGAPAITATLGNHVDALVLTLPPVTPHIRSGALRGIGVASDKRNSAIPDVPTYGEMGYPNVYSGSWVGFFAPAKTPDAVVREAQRRDQRADEGAGLAGEDRQGRLRSGGEERRRERTPTTRARSRAGARWSTPSASRTDGRGRHERRPKTLRHLSDLEAAGLDARRNKRAALEQVAAQYAVAITPAMAELIDRTDPHDPIARQFVPDPAELDVAAGGARRPDRRPRPQPGRRHRASLSRPRAAQAHPRLRGLLPLLLPARDDRPRRRAADGGSSSTPRSTTSPAHPEIWEVMLTGGDPLVLSARRLKQVVSRLAAIAARQGDPRAHPRAGRRSRRASRRSWSAR